MPHFFIKNVYWNEVHLWKLNVNCENISKLLKCVHSLLTLYYLYGDKVHDQVTRTGRKPLSARVSHGNSFTSKIPIHEWDTTMHSLRDLQFPKISTLLDLFRHPSAIRTPLDADIPGALQKCLCRWVVNNGSGKSRKNRFKTFATSCSPYSPWLSCTDQLSWRKSDSNFVTLELEPLRLYIPSAILPTQRTCQIQNIRADVVLSKRTYNGIYQLSRPALRSIIINFMSSTRCI